MARRPDPGAVLNQRGQRLSAKGAHDVITGLAPAAGLDDDATTHVLRHTSRRRSSAAGPTSSSSPSSSAGHARLETTRGYTRPSAEDRTRALDLLLVDQ